MTSFFYTTDGDIKTVENMVSVADNFKNSVKGRKVKISRSRLDTLSIGEIIIFDENNVAIPRSSITATQSSKVDNTTTYLATKALDENNDSAAVTAAESNAWLEFDLGSEKNISRIFITNRLNQGDGETNKIRNTIVQIINNAGAVVFHYDISNIRKQTYNIYVNRTPDFIIGKEIKISQEFSTLNISEIRIYNEKGELIPQSTYTITQSSFLDKTAYPSNNLINDNLDDFIATNNTGLNWLSINLGGDKKISRIVVNNRQLNRDRINGAKLIVLNNANETVWSYNFEYTSAPVFDIIIENKWNVYRNTSVSGDAKYTLIKQIGDDYYCSSLDRKTCALSDYITARNIANSGSIQAMVNVKSETVPKNDLYMVANVNDPLQQYSDTLKSIATNTQTLNNVTKNRTDLYQNKDTLTSQYNNLVKVETEEFINRNKLNEKNKIKTEMDYSNILLEQEFNGLLRLNEEELKKNANHKKGLIGAVVAGVILCVILCVILFMVNKSNTLELSEE